MTDGTRCQHYHFAKLTVFCVLEWYSTDSKRCRGSKAILLDLNVNVLSFYIWKFCKSGMSCSFAEAV